MRRTCRLLCRQRLQRSRGLRRSVSTAATGRYRARASPAQRSSPRLRASSLQPLNPLLGGAPHAKLRAWRKRPTQSSCSAHWSFLRMTGSHLRPSCSKAWKVQRIQSGLPRGPQSSTGECVSWIRVRCRQFRGNRLGLRYWIAIEMKPIVLAPDARAEFEAAVDWYEAKAARAALRHDAARSPRLALASSARARRVSVALPPSTAALQASERVTELTAAKDRNHRVVRARTSASPLMGAIEQEQAEREDRDGAGARTRRLRLGDRRRN